MVGLLFLMLLAYGISIESRKCPVECNCMETAVMDDDDHEFANSEVEAGALHWQMGRGVNGGGAANASGFQKALLAATTVAYPSKANFKENAGGEMFTYQITCDGLRDLGSRSLPASLPPPTTQLIIRAACFESVNAFFWTLRATASQLTVLTDFSITSSQILRQQPAEFPITSAEGKAEDALHCKHLQILNLSNNTLTHLPRGLFLRCYRLQTLDLSNNQITNFDDEIFHPLINLLRLDLHGNNLKWLSEGIFRNLTKLLTLDISHNTIVKVSPSTFQYLINLNTLVLADNPFKRILALLGIGKRLHYINASKTGLRQIPSTLERSVRDLQLADNLLSSIQCGDLDSYPLLSDLNLNHNKISYIEDDAMGRLEFLRNLQLSQNNLFQVPKSLPNNLQVLNLSYNILQNISNTDFLNLSLLKELSLSNNHIHHVEWNSFVNLNSLEILDLSKNPLLYLTPMHGLIKLKVLNLSYCTAIPKEWRKFYQSFPTPTPSSVKTLYLDSSPLFGELFLEDTGTLQLFANITHLFLRFSNLTSLRKDLFDLLPKLKEIRLEGNPWHCDREILKAANWLKTHEKQPIKHEDESDLNTVHCATPTKLHKKLLRTITEEDVLPLFKQTSRAQTQEAKWNRIVSSTSEQDRHRFNTSATTVTLVNVSSDGNLINFSLTHRNASENISSLESAIATDDSILRLKNESIDYVNWISENSSLTPSLNSSVIGNATSSDDDPKPLPFRKNFDYTHPGMLVLMFVASVMATTLGLTYVQIVNARRRQRQLLLMQQSPDIEIPTISAITNDSW